MFMIHTSSRQERAFYSELNVPYFQLTVKSCKMAISEIESFDWHALCKHRQKLT